MPCASRPIGLPRSPRRAQTSIRKHGRSSECGCGPGGRGFESRLSPFVHAEWRPSACHWYRVLVPLFLWRIVSEPEIVETGTTVELPLLRAIVKAQQESQAPWVAAMKAVPDISPMRRKAALEWLADAGYVTPGGHGARSEGLRVVGAWPNVESEFDRLLALLEEQIESATGDDRSRLEAVRDALAGMGKDVATSLLTAFLSRYLP